MKLNKKIKMLDLFAGCGGLTDGFMQTKCFDDIAAVEWKEPQVRTLRHRLKTKWGENDADERVLHYDVQKETELFNGWSDDPDYGSSKGLDYYVKKASGIDIIIGGPPCQAYSVAGRVRDENGMADDYRNFLFEHYLSIVDRYQPDLFIFENVPGILSAATKNISEDLYQRLYDKSRSIMKAFTYSYYLPGAKFTDDKILLDKNEFMVFFTDADDKEFLYLFNAFQTMKFRHYSMNKNSMQLISVYIQNINDITDDEIIIKMQSPLLARYHDNDTNSDSYYTFDKDEFSDVVKENVKIFIQRMNIPVETDDFSIQAIKGKKVIIPVFGRNTDASLGIFKLKGSVALLNVLQRSGIGVRRSTGNGKFEVLG